MDCKLIFQIKKEIFFYSNGRICGLSKIFFEAKKKRRNLNIITILILISSSSSITTESSDNIFLIITHGKRKRAKTKFY